tara:strand:- start:218 stop:466 length:249 start_codon:yes stop_codon:yes gene_type:complete
MLFGGIAFLLASALAEHAFHLNRAPQGTRQSHADEEIRRQLKYARWSRELRCIGQSRALQHHPRTQQAAFHPDHPHSPQAHR